MGLKRRVYWVLEGDSLAARTLGVFIIALILATVLTATFEGSLARALGTDVLQRLEVVVVGVFTFEYLARLWSADWPRASNPRVRHSWLDAMRCRLRAASQPLMLVDLLAILPFFVDLAMPGTGPDLLWLRLIRVFRVFRLFRLARYSAALASIGVVLKQRSRELVVLGFVVIVILMLAANLLWEVEGTHPEVATDDQNQAVQDMGDSFWWSVVTITSTGYGDILPKSPVGKALAAGLMILGVGFVAVPAGLVGASLLEMTEKMNLERWKSDNYNGHIIICGWNKSGEAALRELHAAERERIVIITRSEELPPEIEERCKVIREDFTKDAVLRKVLFREPDWHHPYMIVLAERREGATIEDVDARTLMTTMLAERIGREQKGADDEDAIYTITQMLDEDNARALRDSVATANEVFVSGEVLGSMIANSCVAPGSSDILLELFSSAGDNQLFSVTAGQLPNWKEGGGKYGELVHAFDEHQAIPLGFARAGTGRLDRVMNPPAEERVEQANDVIYYVSRRRLF